MSGNSGQTATPPDYTWANSIWGEQQVYAKDQMEKATKWAQEHGTSLDEGLKAIQGQTFDYGRGMMDRSKNAADKYDALYGPMAEAQAKYAMDYASPERKIAAMAQAGAGVSDAFKAAGDAANRNFERYGGDPSVGRGGALDLGIKLKEASAKAGAMDKARRDVETQGQGLLANALGTGEREMGIGLQEGAQGVQAGATGIGEGINTYTAQSPAMANALGWFGGRNQAMQGFVDTTQKGFQNASQNAQIQNAANAADSAGWGKLAGTALSVAAAPFTGGASLALVPAMMAAGAGGTKIAAHGGMIDGYEPGGGVTQDPSFDPLASPGSAVPLEASPSRGAVEDDVSARVQPGEFIFPLDVMRYKGEEWAQKEIIKARKAMGNPDNRPAQPEEKQALNLPPTYRSPGAMHGQAVPLGGA